jgi:hypothetical protein
VWKVELLKNLKFLFYILFLIGPGKPRMHIIRNAGDKKMSFIAGEMINFEVGKMLFDGGVYKNQPHDNVYHNIQSDGVKLLIKPAFGFLYVDEQTLDSGVIPEGVDKLERWTKLLSEKIQTMDDTISKAEMIKYGRRDSYFSLETGDDGFTSTKVKSDTRDTKFYTVGEKIKAKNLDRAVIYGLTSGSLQKIFDCFGYARFTWVVYPMRYLLQKIVDMAIQCDDDNIALDYFSLVYDPNYIIKQTGTPLRDSIESVNRDLLITDIYCINKYAPILSIGLVQVADIIKSKKPDVNDHSPEAKLNSELYAIKSGNSQSLKYVGYAPGLSVWNNLRKIKYCRVRLGALEIMKQLHNPAYSISTYYRIVALNKQIYEINYSDVTIDNSPAPNDVCKNCGTPLYDNIYLTYTKQTDKCCYAYCHICMHSVYNVDGSHTPYSIINKSCITLYDNIEILAKTTYPRTTNQIIDLIPNDSVREIVRSFYSNNNTYISAYEPLLFINCTADSNKANKLLDSKIYVGFKLLTAYVEYCTGQNTASNISAKEFFGSYATTVHQNSILIPLDFVDA